METREEGFEIGENNISTIEEVRQKVALAEVLKMKLNYEKIFKDQNRVIEALVNKVRSLTERISCLEQERFNSFSSDQSESSSQFITIGESNNERKIKFDIPKGAKSIEFLFVSQFYGLLSIELWTTTKDEQKYIKRIRGYNVDQSRVRFNEQKIWFPAPDDGYLHFCSTNHKNTSKKNSGMKVMLSAWK